MKYSLVALASLATFVAATPQGVTAQIPAPGAPVCNPSYPGPFELSVVNASSFVGTKTKRASGGALILTLSDGILKDSEGRTGYIASNDQFQFDDPPQAGAKYTSGFSVCSNSTLALASAIFYECASGGFFNLYDTPLQSTTCYPVFLDTMAYSSGIVTSPIVTPTVASDGQPAATGAAPPAVSQIGDGQPQVPTMTVPPPMTAPPPMSPTNGSIPTPPPYNNAPGLGSRSLAAIAAGGVFFGALLL